MDIICLLKRNASDSDLCQAGRANLPNSNTLIHTHASAPNKLIHTHTHLQGSVLVWPYRYTALLGPLPMAARPLEPVKAKKKTEYLKLAEALLDRAPRESSGRSVQFLLNLCDERFAPQDPPQLPWIENDCGPPSEIGLSRIAGRIAPAMKFYAKHL